MRLKLIAGMCVTVLLSFGAASGQVSLEPLYVSGVPAPGDPTLTVRHVGAAAISQDARLAFWMRVEGPGITQDVNDIWIVTERNGVPEVLARSGETPPGTGGIPLVGFLGANVNTHGEVAIYGVTDFDTNGVRHGVIWLDRGAGLEKIVSSLDPAPVPEAGTSFGFLQADVQGPILNDLGQTAVYTRFAGDLITDANDSALLMGTPAGLSMILREGDPSPVADPAIQFPGDMDVIVPSLNNSSETVFAQVIGLSPTRIALWRGGAHGLQLAVNTGDPVPGAPGATFGSLFLSTSNLNDRGEFGFAAVLAGAVAPANSAVFVSSPSGLRMVTRGGDDLPGEPGWTLRPRLNWTPVVNGVGDAAFVATLTPPAGTATTGVIREADGTLEVIARHRDPAIGMGPADFFSSLRSFYFNAAGTVVVYADVDDDDFRTDPQVGYWYCTAGGDLAPLFVPGQQMDLGGGDVRTIRDAYSIGAFFVFGTRGAQSGVPTALNDADEFVAQVRFTDGSSALVKATFAQACPCETDDAPGVDVFDLLAYLDLWFVGDAAAERTGDAPHSVDVFDLLAFLDCWFAASAGGECG